MQCSKNRKFMSIEREPQNPKLEVETLNDVVIRPPCVTDGASVNALIANCPPLDRNSLYCNLLQCTHFSATSALAEQEGKVIGFASGYRLPDEPETLFIWQVAVDRIARGRALGKRLILELYPSPTAFMALHWVRWRQSGTSIIAVVRACRWQALLQCLMTVIWVVTSTPWIILKKCWVMPAVDSIILPQSFSKPYRGRRAQCGVR